MAKIIMEGIEKHTEYKAVISHSWHSFMRGRSCLSNLASFYDRIAHLDDPGKPAGVICWDFSKAFDTLMPSLWTHSPSHSWITTGAMGEQLAHG